MSCYLYSMDHKQLTQSTTLSRLILALVRPFEREANRAFLVEAQAKQDAELKQLREAGEQIGFGNYELDDPLDGWEGVRGTAFVLADAALPQELNDTLVVALTKHGRTPDQIREDFQEARRFIADQALTAANVLIN